MHNASEPGDEFGHALVARDFNGERDETVEGGIGERDELGRASDRLPGIRIGQTEVRGLVDPCRVLGR